jgi:hypothetical protein
MRRINKLAPPVRISRHDLKSRMRDHNLDAGMSPEQFEREWSEVEKVAASTPLPPITEEYRASVAARLKAASDSLLASFVDPNEYGPESIITEDVRE